MDGEEQLIGGHASGDVIRIGDTVRKAWHSTTPQVIEFMDALRARGIDVPGTHGRDQQGRLILDFVPGTPAIDVAPLPGDVIRRVGSLIRTIHDTSEQLPLAHDWPAGLLPAPTLDLLCHNDLATWNLVIDGDRLVFIDWDGAGPSSRSWDLAYAAIAFAHLFPDANVHDGAERLRDFLAGYEADDTLRALLPRLMVERADAMYELLRTSHCVGREPWASMYGNGHGDHWLGTTRFIDENQEAWETAIRRTPTQAHAAD